MRGGSLHVVERLIPEGRELCLSIARVESGLLGSLVVGEVFQDKQAQAGR